MVGKILSFLSLFLLPSFCLPSFPLHCFLCSFLFLLSFKFASLEISRMYIIRFHYFCHTPFIYAHTNHFPRFMNFGFLLLIHLFEPRLTVWPLYWNHLLKSGEGGCHQWLWKQRQWLPPFSVLVPNSYTVMGRVPWALLHPCLTVAGSILG